MPNLWTVILLSILFSSLPAYGETIHTVNGENVPRPARPTVTELFILEAELLTLKATSLLTPPQDILKRVAQELEIIQTSHLDVSEIHPRFTWSPHNMTLHFDTDAAKALDDDSYHTWDNLNSRYRVTQIIIIKSEWATLKFAEPYNMPLLVNEYSKLPNVVYADPGYTLGDGDDICLTIEGGVHFYIFKAGSGDCYSGCVNRTYWGFSADSQGQIMELGMWKRDYYNSKPSWLKDHGTCEKSF